MILIPASLREDAAPKIAKKKGGAKIVTARRGYGVAKRATRTTRVASNNAKTRKIARR